MSTQQAALMTSTTVDLQVFVVYRY